MSAEPLFVAQSKSALDGPCAALAVALPLALTLWRLNPNPEWRADLAVVHMLGLVPTGPDRAVSTVLSLGASVLPFGGKLLRAALVSAVGLGAGSWLIYRIAEALLPRGSRVAGPLLALGAALSATLSPSWQVEAHVAGGATVAASTALLGLFLMEKLYPNDPRAGCALGAVLALAASENLWAGGALVGAVLLRLVLAGQAPSERYAVWGAAAALLAALVAELPFLIRPFAPRAWLDLGYALNGLSGGGRGHWMAAEAGFTQLGPAVLGLGALGAVGLLQERLRSSVAPLGGWAIAGVLLAAQPAASSVKLLGLGAMTILAALGAAEALGFLKRVRVPFAQSAAALLLLVALASALGGGGDSNEFLERRLRSATDVWTTTALESLPRGSALVVRDEAIAWRLWSTRIARGDRPDLTIVPLALLDRGSLGVRLLAQQPALTPLIRETALTGKPGEFAMSTLADAAPVYVELDPHWDRRVIDHLAPGPFWMSFAPHPLGRSDRKGRADETHRALERVRLAASRSASRDPDTLAMLASSVSQEAAALAALGDQEAALDLLADLRATDPSHPLLASLGPRLRAERKSRIDVAALLP